MTRWHTLLLVCFALSACAPDRDDLGTSNFELPPPPLVESGRVNNGWFGIGGSELRDGIPLQFPDAVPGESQLQSSGSPTLFMVDGNPAVSLSLRRFLPMGGTERVAQLTRFDGERWRTFRVDSVDGNDITIQSALYDGAEFSLLLYDRQRGEGSYGIAVLDTESGSFGEPVWIEVSGRSNARYASGKWKIVVEAPPSGFRVLEFIDGEWSSKTAETSGRLESLSHDGELALFQTNEDTEDGPTRTTLSLWDTTRLERVLVVEPEEMAELVPTGTNFTNNAAVYSDGEETYLSWTARGTESPTQQFFGVRGNELVELGSLPNAWTQGRFTGLASNGTLVAATSFNGPGQADIRVLSLNNDQLATHDRDVPGGGGISNSQDTRSAQPVMANDGERVCVAWQETGVTRLLCNDDLVN